MIRTVAVCLSFGVFVTLLSAGDERTPDQPPPTLKKKEKPGADRRPGESALDERTKELLARVARNMESSEDRLKNRDPGEKTRAIQEQIIHDLDELIKKSKEQENKESSSQQSASSSQGGGGQSGRSQQQQQAEQQQRQQAGQQQQQAGQQQQQGAQAQQKNGQGKKDQTAGGQQQIGKDKSGKEGGNTAGGGGNSSAKNKNTIADLFRDVWGHLPEQKRQEMDAYSRERFMPRYDELLRQYYRTLSEQNRKKDE
jgi:hypothetical protein